MDVYICHNIRSHDIYKQSNMCYKSYLLFIFIWYIFLLWACPIRNHHRYLPGQGS